MRFTLTQLPRFVLTRISLRASLILIMLTALSVLLIDRSREAAETRAREIEHAYAGLVRAAESAAGRQANLIAQAKAVLRLAADLDATSAFAGAECHETFRDLKENSPWLTSLAAFDAQGFPRCASTEHLARISFADRDYFQEALAKQDFAVSDYIVGRVTGKPVLVVAYPIILGGEAETVMVASIDLASMNQIAAEAVSAEGTEVLLLDGELTVLAAHPEADTWVGRNLRSQPGFAAAIESSAETMATASLDGRERLVGRARLGDTDATLAVMLPLDQVVRIASIRAWREFVTIVIGGTILLAAIWLGGEMLVVRPIRSLTRGAEILGAGEFAINIPTEGLPPELRRLAETFNAMAERLDDREARLREANQALASLAAKDPLTGLANRRAFDERMASEWSRARRERKPLALLMIDVDHFKSFNDAYGHLEGDSCLRHVAAVMEGCARRGGDFAARIGGEEFALILPGASRSAAATVAEHLRGAIAGLGIEHEKVQEGHVTISAGVAATTTASAESPDFLINQADAALYEAKWGGRNKVCLARPDVSLAS